MTIDQAIHTVDELKPNQIERARKIDWLERLDRRIFHDLIRTHERNSGEDTPEHFDGYDQAAHPDTVLLAPAPYDEIYRFYLEMHIDLVNQEYDKYNNSAMLYDASWGQLARMWHREHRPLKAAGSRLCF